MTRRLALALLFVAGSLVAAPVPKALKKGGPPPVAGTTWYADDCDHGPVKYTFEAGGRLTYSHKGGTFRNGTWAQEGDSLTWETNQRYAEYTLQFADGGFLGSARNVTGYKWDVAIRPNDK